MLVPQYWAEGRVQHRQPARQITIRRFGWSDASQAEAQAAADARAAEALQRVLAGEKLARRELKRPYNGAVGVPIREEIVSRHGETIVTRNSYGARCLNTPNALFADVDFEFSSGFRFGCVVFAFLIVAAGAVGWTANSGPLAAVLAFAAIVLASSATGTVHRAIQRLKGGVERAARSRIARFAAAHPDWNLRLYRTPAGLRVLVAHQPFSPNDPAVRRFFKAIGTDPLYARMCWNQQCFRARVSPKPWRIGIDQHMKPRPGVWPVRPETMGIRNEWIAAYEARATSFAACEYVESIGSDTVHPAIKPVQELHDSMCRATSGLPIA